MPQGTDRKFGFLALTWFGKTWSPPLGLLAARCRLGPVSSPLLARLPPPPPAPAAGSPLGLVPVSPPARPLGLLGSVPGAVASSPAVLPHRRWPSAARPAAPQ